METNIPDILSSDNYTTLVKWLSNPDAETPEFAAAFMTSLDAVYMNRTGQAIRRRRAAAAARLSLDFLIKETEAKKNEATIRYEKKTNPILEDLTALAESLPETPSMEKHEAAEPRIRRMGDNNLQLPDENGFTDIGMDSLRLAGAVAWHWYRLNNELRRGRAITMPFLQMTLYVIYGTFLAERKARLTAEKPQMWRYGPVFARVYSKLSKTGIQPDESAATDIRQQDPSLDEFIGRIVRINAGRKTKDLTEYHMSKSSPWGRCNSRNPQKWSTPLDDKEMADWFRKAIDRSKQ